MIMDDLPACQHVLGLVLSYRTGIIPGNPEMNLIPRDPERAFSGAAPWSSGLPRGF
jgi:hypothetical protein